LIVKTCPQVLVGVKSYNHADLPNLEFSEGDVTDLAELLRPAGYAVSLLATSENDPDSRPTRPM
jgi:hypothetical protein